MLDVQQFHTEVVRVSLGAIGLGGTNAEQLVLGTALTESKLTYLKQMNDGPARGLFQMEKPTHTDIWDNYINYKNDLVRALAGIMVDGVDAFSSLAGNHYYAAAMCRIHYARIRQPLPDANDIEGMANYWKQYYNTELGAGKPENFLQYKQLIMETTNG